MTVAADTTTKQQMQSRATGQLSANVRAQHGSHAPTSARADSLADTYFPGDTMYGIVLVRFSSQFI